MQASVCSGEFLDVRPVEHAGDAAVDRAERADQVRRIDVVGDHLGAERALHDVAVVVERAVRQHVAQEALPHVAVGIDEARHHDAVFRVDHLRVRRADVRPHRRDLLAFDQNVGLLEIADRAVERQHAAALDQDRPAGLRGSPEPGRRWPSRSRLRRSRGPRPRLPRWCRETGAAKLPGAADSTDNRN